MSCFNGSCWALRLRNGTCIDRLGLVRKITKDPGGVAGNHGTRHVLRHDAACYDHRVMTNEDFILANPPFTGKRVAGNPVAVPDFAAGQIGEAENANPPAKFDVRRDETEGHL